MPKLALSQSERAQLAAILGEELEAAKLRSLVETWFGVRFDLIAPGASSASAPEALLDWVTLKDHTDTFIAHLLRDTPKTPKLTAFLARLGTQGDESPLQALLTYNGPMQPWNVFGAQMQQRGRHICRIEISATPKGTGVLIAPDLVLTAYHVIKDCLDAQDKPKPGAGEQIRCRFDHVALADGTELQPGQAVALASDWLGPLCPAHPHDGKDLELPNPPDCVELLDYAILKLAKPIGKLPMDPGGGPERGCVDLTETPTEEMTLETDQPLVIGQHPGGQALHISVGLFTAMDQRKARLRYKVSTMKGSSGAPCFDLRFDLIGLHHAEVLNHRLNQAIPIWLIRDHIKARGGLAPRASLGFVPLWQLQSGAPVLGRGEFQHFAWEMRAVGSARRILVVKGDEDSGRSFSIDILKGLLAGCPDVVVDYDMAAIRDKAPDSFLLDLARDLKLPVDSAPPRPDDRQSARWASTVLFDWFTAAFAHRYPARAEEAVSIWIALDNFDRKAFVNEETVDILVRLLRGARRLVALRWLLIGGAPDPTKVPAQLVQEEQIRTPGAAEVTEYLKRYQEHHGKSMDPEMLETLGMGVIAKAHKNRTKEEPFLRTLANGTAAFAKKSLS